MLVYDDPREPGTDEHAKPIGGKGKKALSGVLDLFAGFLLCVHIARDEEEVVANAMQDNPRIQHPGAGVDIPVCKTDITKDPGRHAQEQHLLYPDAVEEKRNGNDEYAFGNLAQDHFAGGIAHAQLIQKGVGKTIVEGKGDTNQDSGNKEDEIGPVLKQYKGFRTQRLRSGSFGGLTLWRSVGQQEAGETENGRGARCNMKGCGRFFQAEITDQ